MLLWHVNFHTPRSLRKLPRLLSAASEMQDDARYFHAGVNRQNDRHCLFKYSLRGTGVFRDASGEHMVEPGQGFLCEIRDPDTAYYYPPESTEEWEFVYLCFGGQSATELVREITERYGPIFEVPMTDPIIQRMLGFERYDGVHREMPAPQGAAIVYELLTGLSARREAEWRDDAANLLVRRAREVVAESDDPGLNATELAEALGVSREHLTRVFGQETGATPYQYIVRQRMLRACRLLKDSNLSVKEISAQMGYSDPAHFNRVFRQTVLMPPSEFRRSGAMPVF